MEGAVPTKTKEIKMFNMQTTLNGVTLEQMAKEVGVMFNGDGTVSTSEISLAAFAELVKMAAYQEFCDALEADGQQ